MNSDFIGGAGILEHDGCAGCKYERESESSRYCLGCNQNAVDKYTRMTNADKIRSMSNGELEQLINKVKFCGGLIAREETSQECRGCTDGFCSDVKEWLERELDV